MNTASTTGSIDIDIIKLVRTSSTLSPSPQPPPGPPTTPTTPSTAEQDETDELEGFSWIFDYEPLNHSAPIQIERPTDQLNSPRPDDAIGSAGSMSSSYNMAVAWYYLQRSPLTPLPPSWGNIDELFEEEETEATLDSSSWITTESEGSDLENLEPLM